MKGRLLFENSKGDKLCGILSNPSFDKDRPLVILCHGFSTNKDAKTYLRLEEVLNKKNLSTFRFDFYGHGESDGKFEDITISEAVDDAFKAIKLIKGRGYKKIGLFGSSFGGMVSIIVASKIEDLFVLALKSPVSNYMGKLFAQRGKQGLKTWKQKGFIYYLMGDGSKLRLKHSFFEDSMKNDGYKAAKKIKAPTLIVHGDEDNSVPIEQSRRTATLIKNCKLEIIEGADHQYSKPKHFEKMLSLISNFIIGNC